MALPHDTASFLSLLLLSAIVFVGESLYTLVPTAWFEPAPIPETIRPTGAAKRLFYGNPATDNRDISKTATPGGTDEK